MISIVRKILNLNERLAYSLLGKLRQIVIFPFNHGLNYQEHKVQQMISKNETFLFNRLCSILPEIDRKSLESVTDEDSRINILNSAQKAINKKFCILSYSIKFDDAIDWHVDFNSNFRWPKGKLYYRYNQVDLDDNADVKVPRELSRCHHFLTLGEAYILSGDEVYAKEFVSQTLDWIQENPYKKSINWGCSMDVAIRSSNWIYSLAMFRNSTLIRGEFMIKILTSLFLHGRFIFENPEKNRVYNHNHYLSDLAGQILLGLLFKKESIPETDAWLKDGIYEFYREIRIQILPTGFSYERSINYQRLVTEIISYTLILLENNEFIIPKDIMFRAFKMYEASMFYIDPTSGKAPIIGDQDSGRYLPFFPYDVNYHKYLLTVGSVLFENDTFKESSENDLIDVLFLFGPLGLKKYKRVKTVKNNSQISKPFPDAGFYIMRGQKSHIFINNSGQGHYSELSLGTHTHSDLLSFTFSYAGIPFFVDSGTFVYSSDPKNRKKFRSTYMHNTVTVDDRSQHEIDQNLLWSMHGFANPEEIYWSSTAEKDLFKGCHFGYNRLVDPVIHSREFELLKESDSLLIKDSIDAEGNHLLKLHFHFDEKIVVTVVDKEVFIERNEIQFKISFDIDVPYSIELMKEYISKSYGHKVLAPYIVISFSSSGKIEFKSSIIKISNVETNI